MKIFTKITTSLLIALALGATVTSCKKDVEKVEVTPATVTLDVTKSTQLSATVTPDKAEYTLAWSSSDPAVAIVDANGKVTAITEGTATISAEAGGKKGTCEVTVVSDVPAPSDGLTVTFGDAPAWTAEYIQGTEAVSAGMMQIFAAQNAPSGETISFPIVDIVTENTEGAIDLTASQGYLEYYEVTGLQDPQGNRFGDWWCVDQDGSYYGDGSPTVNITALANGKISGNVSVVMFNAKEKYVDQNADFSTRNLTISFHNVDLQTAKKMMQSLQKRHTIANTNNVKLRVTR
jgi:hypothetical protein